jgi:hypothetical protein
MSSFYTHRQYLHSELSKLDFTKKVKCLEFGTGDGSCVIFKEFTDKYENLTVLSYESDLNWLNESNQKYNSKNYIFKHVDWNEFLLDDNFTEVYDLIFVDQSPWEARIKTIEILSKKAKVVILHDYDFYNKGVCEGIFSIDEGSFFYEKFSKDFDMFGYNAELPPTLIMYNKNF